MRPEHSARELHTQLLSFERLFDAKYAQRRADRAHRRKPTEHGAWVSLCEEDRGLCDALLSHVRSRLAANAFNFVNVKKLCSLVRGTASGGTPATLGIVSTS
jgi:hypothetical protein